MLPKPPLLEEELFAAPFRERTGRFLPVEAGVGLTFDCFPPAFLPLDFLVGIKVSPSGSKSKSSRE